jgi:hypothetical protein
MTLGKPKLDKMRIEVRRFVNKNGDEMYHIEKIEGIGRRDELPNEYLQGECVYLDTFPGRDQPHVGVMLKPHGKSIVEGSNMTREEFESSYMYVLKCGTRLKEINDRIDKKRVAWKGKEVYEV